MNDAVCYAVFPRKADPEPMHVKIQCVPDSKPKANAQQTQNPTLIVVVKS